MDADSWPARLSSSSSSKRYLFAPQSRSVGMKWDGYDAEMLTRLEEIDLDGDMIEEYPCPFCMEYYDIVGLCGHIDDEHPIQAKNGVCPVCAMRLNVDLVAHVTLQHGHIFKMQRRRKSHKAGSHSTIYLFRRELREGNLQPFFGGSSCIVSSSNAAPDSLLSSFILPTVDDFGSISSHLSAELESEKKSDTKNISERNTPMSIEDQEEKAKRCAFVQGLLLFTIIDDNL